MKDLYYNVHEFNYARDLMDIDPYKAKEAFLLYIERYPQDYRARAYYASVLIILRELDEANRVIEDLEYEAYSNREFMADKNAIFLKHFRQNITFAKIKLLFYQNKYQELYDTYFNNDKIIDIYKDANIYLNQDMGYFRYDSLAFYVKKKLNLIPHDVNNSSYTYLYKQIINYQDEMFLDHIKKHMADFNIEADTPNKSIFKYDFPLDLVFSEIKKYIPSERCLYSGLVEDTYVFKYDSCGWNNNKMVNYFKIVCFHGTSEFITMCPTKTGEYFPYIDLNYMNANINTDSVKVKRRSQIDKFNKKYGIN